MKYIMQNLNRISKIFLCFAILFGTIWIGSYISRLVISYQLFEGPELQLLSFINKENLNVILFLIRSIIVLTVITYFAFIINYTIFILTSRIKLKYFGWLFIVTILIYITFPFELYLILNDINFIQLTGAINFNNDIVFELFIERFSLLGSFPIIELFCYFAIIFLLIFKPLEKLPKNED